MTVTYTQIPSRLLRVVPVVFPSHPKVSTNSVHKNLPQQVVDQQDPTRSKQIISETFSYSGVLEVGLPGKMLPIELAKLFENANSITVISDNAVCPYYAAGSPVARVRRTSSSELSFLKKLSETSEMESIQSIASFNRWEHTFSPKTSEVSSLTSVPKASCPGLQSQLEDLRPEFHGTKINGDIFLRPPKKPVRSS